MMEYLVRMAQIHETFRVPELRALARIEGIEMEVVEYDDDVSFFFVFWTFEEGGLVFFF